jgi:hypothetical protein
MSDDIKRIPLKEFRELGFIQEINRRVLHPCGLALEVILDTETGEEKFGGVWDYRDDPEGMAFGEVSADKARSVDDLWFSKIDTRMENFGWVVQPVPEDEKEQVELD